MKSSPCSSFSCENGSSPVAEATSDRSWLRLSHSATCALTPTETACEFTRAAKTCGELARRAEREVRGVVGTALVAEAIEQRRALEPELLDPRAHRGQADAREQRVRGERVAGRCGEHREVRQRQRRRLEVLPDARDARPARPRSAR